MTTKAVTETVKKASSKGLRFGIGGVSFGLGLYGMGKIQGLTDKLPSFIPEIIRKMIPGIAIMGLSYWASTKTKDDRIQAALLGLGFSGGADAFRRLLGPIFPGIKDYVPGLNGTQGAEGINVGDFQMPYYWENAFQGLRGNMSMQGMSMQGMSMQGPGPFSLNGPGAFALNGKGAYSLMGKRRRLRGLPAYALN